MATARTKPVGATSYKQTAFGTLSHSDLLSLELQGIQKGLRFIYDLFQLRKSARVTPRLIKKLHEVSFHWIFPEWAGKFRTINVEYSGKEAPNYFRVPELVENLCADLQVQREHLPERNEHNYIEKVVGLLAWFQHRFVYIHPFQDYNGRTARMLTMLLLLSLDLPPVEIRIEKQADRATYLRAMQQADNGDLSLLEQLIGDALIEAFLKASQEEELL